MLAVLSPGQGSQKPGFLAPWLELSGAETRLRWWSALAGLDLLHLGSQAGTLSLTLGVVYAACIWCGVCSGGNRLFGWFAERS